MLNCFLCGKAVRLSPSFFSGYDKQNCYPNVTVDGENKTRYVREPVSQHLVSMRYHVTSPLSLYPLVLFPRLNSKVIWAHMHKTLPT